MTSWRETTPQHIQDDLDSMIPPALDRAVESLNKRGEFYPFGFSLSVDGQMALVGSDPGLGDNPPSDTVMAVLVDGFLRDADTLRAIAIVADVRIADGDAVRVSIEHREGGPALTVLAPYSRSGRIKKTFSYGAISASRGEHLIWPTPDW